ncbi:thiamine/thiamine pyrophosphate ABC transporter permease ThiP [Rhizobium sp. YIM 134829]|uniref:thiamine/thiamine pyrophosphate ABC transporter permease ThiP n=1 Tax=Rhizobium sp. YIM 134829 TaxID=3390453 RepID=UPI003978F695
MTILSGLAALAAIGVFVIAAPLALGLASGISQGGLREDSRPLIDAYVLNAARFTLLQAVLSTALSVLLAIPVALAIARRRQFPGRIWLLRLLALPLGLPALVGALGLLSIWGRQGAANTLLDILGFGRPLTVYGLQGILLAHVFFNLPLAVRLMVAGLDRIPSEYFLLGANLGLSRLSLLRFVEGPVLRALMPGIAGLILMLCVTSFTLVLTLGGGPAASTIEVAIYQALRFDFDLPRAIALAGLQLAITALLLLAFTLLGSQPAESETSGRVPRRFDGAGLPSRLGDAGVIALAALFVASPMLAVLIAGLRADLVRLALDPAVHRALLTSLAIATASSILSVLLTFFMLQARLALIARRSRQPSRLDAAKLFSAAVSGATSLVLLVPPVVLGAGWFLALRPTGDVARYAPVIIVAINALMALPFVARILAPALATHAARTARLADSLGMAGWSRLRWIDAPVLARPLAMALSFAAALSLGDLGAVAIFGSNEVVTLPYLLFSRMGSYRTLDAAGLALLLGLVCLLLTMAGTPRREIALR